MANRRANTEELSEIVTECLAEYDRERAEPRFRRISERFDELHGILDRAPIRGPLDDLERIASLHKNGALTDSEYRMLKQPLLERLELEL